MEITPARLAETEYHRLIDPQYLYPSRFGDFYNHAGFRTRHDAHQLCRTICQAGQVVDLLQEIDQLYAGLGLGHKKISGHDLATYHNIEPEKPIWLISTASIRARMVNYNRAISFTGHRMPVSAASGSSPI